MKLYDAGDIECDLLVARWWMQMRDSGELETTFLSSAHTLAGLHRVFQSAELLFEADDRGIWFAAWGERFMSGVMFGLWLRPDKRKKLGTFKKLLDVYEMLFNSGAMAIFGVTRQPDLLPSHRKIGYNVLGKVPGLWEGHDAWIMSLEREVFYGRWRRQRGSQPEQVVGGEQPCAVQGIDSTPA